MAESSSKSDAAFRTISEVADDLNVPQHVLRFWETKFSAIKPLKRGGNRRYYRPEDVQLLMAINKLLYIDGYTIRGVQKLLRDQGVRSISAQHGTAEALAAAKKSGARSQRRENLTPSAPSASAPTAPYVPEHHGASAESKKPINFAGGDSDKAVPSHSAEAEDEFVEHAVIRDQIHEPVMEFEPDASTVHVGLFPLPKKAPSPQDTHPAATPSPSTANAPADLFAPPAQQPIFAAPAQPQQSPPVAPEDYREDILAAMSRLEAVRTKLQHVLAR